MKGVWAETTQNNDKIDYVTRCGPTLTDRREITRRLLACVIKLFITADWWNKTLRLGR